jgi:selenocysteine lyase/cysteine desulfurase
MRVQEAQAVSWQKVRGDFPAMSNWTYLNTAAFGQLPRCGSEAMVRHLKRRDELACDDYIAWFDDLDGVRALCAKLVNGTAEDIAFIPNTCSALATLIQGIDWKPDDEILTLCDEFPNQIYQCESARRFGFKYRAVAWPEFYSAVNARTRLVLISTVNYATGFRPPLEEMGNFLRERGVLLYVDGTQSVGALQFDVRKVRPAMLAVDAYKWLMSPNGAGFAYVDPELRYRLPPSVVGWRSDAGWRNVSELNHGLPALPESAQKYEGGMLNFSALYAMGAVIEMVLDLDPAVIEQRVLELAGMTRSILRSLGAEVNSHSSPIVTAVFPGRDSDELANRLRQQRILLSSRHGRLRISTHIYNLEEDLETLERSLRSHCT